MLHTPVSSSNVASVGYDPETRELEVAFKGGDSLYRYLNVSPEEYAALMSSASIGGYINAVIKPRHTYEKVGG